jgi:hypothetical protein
MQDEHPLVKIWRKELEEDPDGARMINEMFCILHDIDFICQKCWHCKKDLMAQSPIKNAECICKECYEIHRK